MSNNHIIQYAIVAVIALVAVITIIRHIVKIKRCNDHSDEGYCQCCSSKSFCGKKKKSANVADSKK